MNNSARVEVKSSLPDVTGKDVRALRAGEMLLTCDNGLWVYESHAGDERDLIPLSPYLATVFVEDAGSLHLTVRTSEGRDVVCPPGQWPIYFTFESDGDL